MVQLDQVGGSLMGSVKVNLLKEMPLRSLKSTALLNERDVMPRHLSLTLKVNLLELGYQSA